MSPEEKEAFILHRNTNDQQFKDKLLSKFNKTNDSEKKIFYICIIKFKQNVWEEIKNMSQKGSNKERKKWGPIVQELYRMAKERKEKLP
ncbi:hypothetical protein A946_02030 [Methylacidiphilum kamchatkense Kam1]|uniref:Uncharacterized protein n=1 Tax=Methylacidiphilum kamchatkense Kam1 TaxID=1202785 RepID=A0ABR4ZZ29_9BACT|nr:hypothetical protein [Methylacidiphilum kamchatkense]KIE59472.1 hypothetical protein A946_02030 [Methylacidiphilum kamchatkense Kam1]